MSDSTGGYRNNAAARKALAQKILIAANPGAPSWWNPDEPIVETINGRGFTSAELVSLRSKSIDMSHEQG